MSRAEGSLKKFFKDWSLVFGMIAGVGLYLIYHSIPSIHTAGPVLEIVCKRLQPILLFCMLFLSFCKIEPHQMRPHTWQAWLLLVQVGCFVLIGGLEIWALNSGTPLSAWLAAHRVPLEAALICIICPTATACAVVTGKLGGNMAGVVTYTVIINIIVAILIPLFVPIIYPVGGMSFGTAFSKILAKVFPLLIMPCITAWLIRYLMPGLHRRLLKYTGLSFDIWIVSLTLAILMTTRAIMQYGGGYAVLLEIAAVSALCCFMQFWTGKRIGAKYGCRISAGQALAQKNTVFGIWIGYTFFDPLTSVACGFYIIWQNGFNSWQLYRRRKEQEASTSVLPVE